MKEMRKKNRLSSVRNYALTTEDFLETTTTTSQFPFDESKPLSSGSVGDKNVDISDNESKPEELENKNKVKVVKTEPVIETNITETEPDVDQTGNVKVSKALIFDDELSSAATAQIRNERNQVKTVKLNNLHSDLLEKAVKKSVAEPSKSVSSVTVDNVVSTTSKLSPLKTSSVQETSQSSSSQKFFVYPQVPALKTYTVDPGAETFCK